MNLYVFSSVNVTNIWAGIGAGMWAVSEQQAQNVSGATAKARDLRVGSPGIIYCSGTQSFTTPFLVASRPEPDRRVVDIWPDPWTLPFRISPLGNPLRQLHKDELAAVLPCLQGGGRPWNHVLLIQPTTVFVASQVGENDWEALLLRLATQPPLGG